MTPMGHTRWDDRRVRQIIAAASMVLGGCCAFVAGLAVDRDGGHAVLVGGGTLSLLLLLLGAVALPGIEGARVVGFGIAVVLLAPLLIGAVALLINGGGPDIGGGLALLVGTWTARLAGVVAVVAGLWTGIVAARTGNDP